MADPYAGETSHAHPRSPRRHRPAEGRSPQGGGAVREFRKGDRRRQEARPGRADLPGTDHPYQDRGRHLLSGLRGRGGGGPDPRGLCRARRRQGADRRDRGRRAGRQVLRRQGQGAVGNDRAPRRGRGKARRGHVQPGAQGRSRHGWAGRAHGRGEGAADGRLQGERHADAGNPDLHGDRTPREPAAACPTGEA